MPDPISTLSTDEALARRAAISRQIRLRLRGLLLLLVLTWLATTWFSIQWQHGDWRRTTLALLPVLPLTALLIYIRRHAGKFDELGRRVLIYGAAWGFAVSLPVIFLYSLIQTAGAFPANKDLPVVLVILWINGWLGVMRALRRYQ
jgi:hypothetical protein